MHARGSGGPRLLPGLREPVALHEGRLPAGPGRAHAGLRALLDRRRLARLDRPGARRARLRGQVLHGGGRSSTSSATTSRSSSSRTPSSSRTSIHAVKPEPDNEMPQAASAHDTFWDFISLMPESMHMIMWVMSDRAIPRSFRMMEGFGVHTFRFVDARGHVALRQVPLEAAARRALGGLGRGAEDLRQGSGLPPPRPLGGDRAGQLPASGSSASRSSRRSGEHDFDFDLLDPTKLIPEELVPVRARRPARR